jgi:hypothetical protein
MGMLNCGYMLILNLSLRIKEVIAFSMVLYGMSPSPYSPLQRMNLW